MALQGRLEDGHVDGLECAWLVDARGRRFDVFYPPGWEVRFDPLRLVDDAGIVIAEEGDVLSVAGPQGIGDSVCSHNVFSAEAVEVVRGIQRAGEQSAPPP